MSSENLRSQIATIEVGSRIHNLRGTQVMLDSDLADLYGVETKRLNEQVKRNLERFPDEFYFPLTDLEASHLKSHFATSSEHGGRRTLPYAFTEQGVAMLSAVLRSDTAVKVSIQIIQASLEMRRFLGTASPARALAKREFLPYCNNSIPAKPLSVAIPRRSNVAGFFLPRQEAS